jgi:hypothetical protein
MAVRPAASQHRASARATTSGASSTIFDAIDDLFARWFRDRRT